MVEIMREWFAARVGKGVRLTRRAALTRDDVQEFEVEQKTFFDRGGICNVSIPDWIMCYGPPSDGAKVLGSKLHCHAISATGDHFFDVYEDA